MLSAGVYSVAGNLYTHWQRKREVEGGLKPWVVGVFAALGAGLLGNLGTLKMIIDGLKEFGVGLPYGPGDWYWIPSRVIPAVGEPEPITEFPWFTTIYADLHAHYMALPLTVLALSWALSVVLSKAWKGANRWQVLWSFAFAGIAIGSLRPTNTWDLPTYLALGVVVVVYAIWRFWDAEERKLFSVPDLRAEKIVLILGAAAMLVGFSFAFYQPYAASYLQPYSQVQLWEGSHTPLSSYFVHWGVFLFILVFWMGWETRQWMAKTPLSHLRKLEGAVPYLVVLAVVFVLVLVGLFVVLEVRIHFLVFPLALWAAILMLRPGISEAKRFVLFLVGTALFLTVLVEVVVLSGDIGRMNTVFKFYLQAWLLLSVGSAAAIGWTVGELRAWNWSWRAAWQFGLVLLVTAAALYPLTATAAKISDRMAVEAPVTLDGMTYMQYAEYPDEGGIVQLEEDYQAIRWMQENIPGTPVIVEANTPLYRWGSRYSIYTGLPAVLGWDWHQTQQRGASQTSDIHGRMNAVHQFYRTEDRAETLRFLREYGVELVIVGQVERNYYPGQGLDKFEEFDGDLWQEIYRDRSTVIYQVIGN
jgi:YYY domain-containing protein